MIKGYLGIDIGSISTKGIIIDEKNNILASSYLWTKGDPIKASYQVIEELHNQIKGKDIVVISTGATGSARRLIGNVIGASVIKNEITAHAIGTLSIYPNVRTILEIGGQDSKIILIEDGIVTDYAMNTLCAAGTGSFLTSQAKRLDVAIETFGKMALLSKNPTKVAARCTVFAESDLIHKAQMGYKKEDIMLGLCYAICNNYLNNVCKGKKIIKPIIFQGGVSKNIGVVKALEDTINEKIIVDKNSHLMGCLGIAILAKKEKKEKLFTFDIKENNYNTAGVTCHKCPNNCEIICVKKDNKIIDAWGNKCNVGEIKIT